MLAVVTLSYTIESENEKKVLRKFLNGRCQIYNLFIN